MFQKKNTNLAELKAQIKQLESKKQPVEDLEVPEPEYEEEDESEEPLEESSEDDTVKKKIEELSKEEKVQALMQQVEMLQNNGRYRLETLTMRQQMNDNLQEIATQLKEANNLLNQLLIKTARGIKL